MTRTPSVKRGVLTSSCAAIYGDNADLQKTPDGIFTEELWKGDNSKSIQELGMQYRPMRESMQDFFQQMIDSGLVPQAK